MTNSDNRELGARLDAVNVEDENGIVRVRIGLRFTLFVPHPPRLETRLALADCMDLYARMTDEHLIKRSLKIGNWHWSPKEQTAREFVAETHAEDKDMEGYLTSSKQLQQASHFNLKLLASSNYNTE